MSNSQDTEESSYINDPLGSVPWSFRAPPKEAAPEFCKLFGRNAYMVRKHVRFEYPIDPNTTAVSPEWLFAPSGPPEQNDLVLLEREIGETDFLRPYLDNHPALHTLSRIEKVICWLRQARKPKLFREWPPSKDLTTADDFLVEAIVAFLAAACSGLDASEVAFSESRESTKTAEFRIERLSATVEVKHLLKVPQGERELRWLNAFKRQDTHSKVVSRPEEKIAERIRDGLATGEETTKSISADEVPWQKATKSISEQIDRADEQLASAPKSDCKIIVIYSDDPHTLTRSENDPDQAHPSENRIEMAVSLARPVNANAIVVIASPFGFPIASGHLCKMYPNGNTPEVVRKMFGCLHPLDALDIRPAAIGLRVKLAPGETRTIGLSNPAEEPPAGSITP